MNKSDTIEVVAEMVAEHLHSRSTQWTHNGRIIAPMQTMDQVEVKSNDLLIQYKVNQRGLIDKKPTLSRRTSIATRRIRKEKEVGNEKRPRCQHSEDASALGGAETPNLVGNGSGSDSGTPLQERKKELRIGDEDWGQ